MDVLCTVTNQYCNVDTIDDTVTGSFQQIDLNRHLEEISQNIESLLVHTVRDIAITNFKKGYSAAMQLIMLWEKYNSLSTETNGKNPSHCCIFLIEYINKITYFL